MISGFLKHIAFFLLLLFGPAGMVMAEQQSELYDENSPVEIRKVSPSKIEKYGSDPDYVYDRTPPKADSWWTSFKQWFWEKVRDLLGKEYAGDIIDIIFYLLVAAALVFIIMKVLKANMRTVIKGEGYQKESMDYRVSEENIHEIDLEELIARALEKKNFREAIRLSYLKILKSLADKDLITWKRDKTNRDYFQEISDRTLRSNFGKISRLYEYVWYGDFKLNEDDFRDTYSQFKNFSKTLYK